MKTRLRSMTAAFVLTVFLASAGGPLAFADDMSLPGEYVVDELVGVDDEGNPIYKPVTVTREQIDALMRENIGRLMAEDYVNSPIDPIGIKILKHLGNSTWNFLDAKALNTVWNMIFDGGGDGNQELKQELDKINQRLTVIEALLRELMELVQKESQKAAIQKHLNEMNAINQAAYISMTFFDKSESEEGKLDVLEEWYNRINVPFANNALTAFVIICGELVNKGLAQDPPGPGPNFDKMNFCQRYIQYGELVWNWESQVLAFRTAQESFDLLAVTKMAALNRLYHTFKIRQLNKIKNPTPRDLDHINRLKVADALVTKCLNELRMMYEDHPTRPKQPGFTQFRISEEIRFGVGVNANPYDGGRFTSTFQDNLRDGVYMRDVEKNVTERVLKSRGPDQVTGNLITRDQLQHIKDMAEKAKVNTYTFLRDFGGINQHISPDELYTLFTADGQKNKPLWFKEYDYHNSRRKIMIIENYNLQKGGRIGDDTTAAHVGDKHGERDWILDTVSGLKYRVVVDDGTGSNRTQYFEGNEFKCIITKDAPKLARGGMSLPEGAPGHVEMAPGSAFSAFSDDSAIAAVADKLSGSGFTAHDLTWDGPNVTVLDGAAMAAAANALGNSGIKRVLTLPVFSANLTNGKEIAAVEFIVDGDDLMAETAEEIKPVKILSPTRGARFEWAGNPPEFADGKFSLLTTDGELHEGEIDPDEQYSLVVFIKAGGKFDHDPTTGTVLGSVALVDAEPKSNPDPKHGGGGCDTGMGGVALIMLVFIAILLANFLYVKRVDRQEREEKRRFSGGF